MHPTEQSVRGQLLEPRSKAELDAITKHVGTVAGQYVWVNYQDKSNSNFLGCSTCSNCCYMGSRSTAEKVPDDMWHEYHKGGSFRDANEHCGLIDTGGLMDWPCDSPSNLCLVVCEVEKDGWWRWTEKGWTWVTEDE